MRMLAVMSRIPTGNGKAVKKSGSSDNVKFVTLPNASGQGRYAFDEEGRMLFGWIDENGEMLTDEDAWKSGMYYCGENGDGRMATGWQYITAENDEDTERDGDGYWFYFATNGKKTKDNDNRKSMGANTALMKTAPPTLNGTMTRVLLPDPMQ